MLDKSCLETLPEKRITSCFCGFLIPFNSPALASKGLPRLEASRCAKLLGLFRLHGLCQPPLIGRACRIAGERKLFSTNSSWVIEPLGLLDLGAGRLLPSAGAQCRRKAAFRTEARRPDRATRAEIVVPRAKWMQVLPAEPAEPRLSFP